jgi:hypothetical protein
LRRSSSGKVNCVAALPRIRCQPASACHCWGVRRWHDSQRRLVVWGAGDGGAERGLPSFSDESRAHVAQELSDVLLYLIRLADVCEVDLGAAVLAKMEVNAAK